MALHAADPVFERVEFRFKLPQADFSRAGVASFENDVPGPLERTLNGLKLEHESENEINEPGGKE